MKQILYRLFTFASLWQVNNDSSGFILIFDLNPVAEVTSTWAGTPGKKTLRDERLKFQPHYQEVIHLATVGRC